MAFMEYIQINIEVVYICCISIVSLFHCFIVSLLLVACFLHVCVNDRPLLWVNSLPLTHSLTHSLTHLIDEPPTTNHWHFESSSTHSPRLYPLTTALLTINYNHWFASSYPLNSQLLPTPSPPLTTHATNGLHTTHTVGYNSGHLGSLQSFMPRLHRLYYLASVRVPLLSQRLTSEALSWFNVHWGVLLSFILPT